MPSHAPGKITATSVPAPEAGRLFLSPSSLRTVSSAMTIDNHPVLERVTMTQEQWLPLDDWSGLATRVKAPMIPLANFKMVLLVGTDPALTKIFQQIKPSPTILIVRVEREDEALRLTQQVLFDLVIAEWRQEALLEFMRRSGYQRGRPVMLYSQEGLHEQEIDSLPPNVITIWCSGVFTMDEIHLQIEKALHEKRISRFETRRLVRKTIAYLHTHWNEPVSRHVLSCQVGMSKEYLSKSFHREVGLTPSVYLQRYRIKQARSLLETTTLSLRAVAELTGFSDEFYLSRVFKKLTGVSPGAYRCGVPLAVDFLE